MIGGSSTHQMICHEVTSDYESENVFPWPISRTDFFIIETTLKCLDIIINNQQILK